MARTYAAVLGLLAAGVLITRAALTGGSLERTMGLAAVAAFAFALVGFFLGLVGEMIVRDSVQLRFQAAMQEWETARSKDKPKPSSAG